MKLALFDLDNTLLTDDSDKAWGDYLVQEGLVSAIEHSRLNEKFYLDYLNGCLNIQQYLSFALKAVEGKTLNDVAPIIDDYFEKMVRPIIAPHALELLQKHRQLGHKIIIITATNKLLAEPAARFFDADILIATDVVIDQGRITTELLGTPSFQEGKITRLIEQFGPAANWADTAYFYSDSINDQPLLDLVANPFAVDPCPKLAAWAEENKAPVISLRD